MIYDCSKKIRSFRFVSLYNGTPFRLYEIFGKSGKLVTNNGTTSICEPQLCINLPNKENIEIKKITNKLLNCHKIEFKNIFSIGWDIIFDCNNNNIKAYCLEGNILHTTWRFPDPINKKLITDYKNKCITFLSNNNYL